ncbi:MAG: hypothetical protein RLZZ275_724, partial [Bacteroidota bacterium]
MSRFLLLLASLCTAALTWAQTPYQLVVETHATHTTGALAGQS